MNTLLAETRDFMCYGRDRVFGLVFELWFLPSHVVSGCTEHR